MCQSVIENYIVKFANLERDIQLASCLKQQLRSGISVQSLFWIFNCIGVLVTCVEAFFPQISSATGTFHFAAII